MSRAALICLLIYLFGLNLTAFVLMGTDKRRARRHARRIPETTLLLTAVIGGSFGALLGLLVFRHKTRHPAFSVGLPVILILQLICIRWAYTFLP